MLSLQSQECAHKRNTSSEEQQESGDLKRPQASLEGYKGSVARADWRGRQGDKSAELGLKHLALALPISLVYLQPWKA